jgi:transcription termination factor Rho
MDIAELQSLKMPELTKLARQLEISEISGIPKHDLIFKVLEKQATQNGLLFATGVLEILNDGYGFLRSPKASYLPSPDDVYVSPSQIKRFNLRTSGCR